MYYHLGVVYSKTDYQSSCISDGYTFCVLTTTEARAMILRQ